MFDKLFLHLYPLPPHLHLAYSYRTIAGYSKLLPCGVILTAVLFYSALTIKVIMFVKKLFRTVVYKFTYICDLMQYFLSNQICVATSAIL